MKEVFYGWVDTIKPYTAERLGSVVAYGNGKGSFELNDLPAELQFAPIFAFHKITGDHGNRFVSAGNFFDVIPYEGRYDALPLAVFNAGKDGTIQYLHEPELLEMRGQYRDIKQIRTGSGLLYVAARNNAPLVFFK